MADLQFTTLSSRLKSCISWTSPAYNDVDGSSNVSVAIESRQLVEITGHPGSGKTAFALAHAWNVLSLTPDVFVVYVDSENGVSHSRLRASCSSLCGDDMTDRFFLKRVFSLDEFLAFLALELPGFLEGVYQTFLMFCLLIKSFIFRTLHSIGCRGFAILSRLVCSTVHA